jgi:hypothetical protein
VTVGEPNPAFPADALDEAAPEILDEDGPDVFGEWADDVAAAGLALAAAGIPHAPLVDRVGIEMTAAAADADAELARSKASHPSNHAPQPLPGIGGLAATAARQLTDEQLVDSLEQIAAAVRSIPAGDRAAILREAAHRIRA